MLNVVGKDVGILVMSERFEYKEFFIGIHPNINGLKLYEIDLFPSNDLCEEYLFHVYSDSKENIEHLVGKLNELYEENQHLQKMNELLFAEIKWNKEQSLKSKDKTPRLTQKEVRDRMLRGF